MNAYKGAKNRIVKKRGRECYEIKLIEQIEKRSEEKKGEAKRRERNGQEIMTLRA